MNITGVSPSHRASELNETGSSSHALTKTKSVSPTPKNHTMEKNGTVAASSDASFSLNQTKTNHTTSLITAALDKYDGSLPHMWNCLDASSHQKLIFVHVFKTAGTTFRNFFKGYGSVCRKGVALVTRCTGLPSHSMADQDSVWLKGDKSDKPCVVKYATNATGKLQTRKVTNSFLQQYIDILIGHFPIGVDRHWFDATQRHVDAQYVTFFRDPIAKFVSGRLFKNPHWTFDEAIQPIKRNVQTDYANSSGYYERYSSYLLTPQQKEQKPGRNERMDLVKWNLVEFRVLVGIVERMGDSLRLLQHAIDGRRELTKPFARLDPKGNHTSGKNAMMNKSKLSTSQIVAELLKDKKFVDILKDYLRYEFVLYDFALSLHERQYQWVLMHEGQPTG